MRLKQKGYVVLGLTALCMMLSFPGITQPPKPKKTPTLAEFKKIAADKKINCVKCHRVGKVGNQGKKAIPLTHIGKEHDYKWIYEKIKDPKSKKPNSKMPKKQMTDAERATLAAFLAAQK